MSALGTTSPNGGTTPPTSVRSPFNRSTALVGGFVRSSKMEEEKTWSGPDYEAIIKAEDRAWELLKAISDYMAEECAMLWKYGDGHGGSILEIVQQAFHKRGCEPKTYGSADRRRIPNKVRTMVFERNEYRCVKCGSYKRLCIDHIYPYSLGGSDDPDNLQTLCWVCNRKKSNKVEVVEWVRT